MSTKALHALIERLDQAVSGEPRALPQAVEIALRPAVTRLEDDWLPRQWCLASTEHYARHLVHADPAGRYALLAIVWGPGQHSPVHGHYCWCGVGIYAGTLMETHYADAREGRAPSELRRVQRTAGDLFFDGAGCGIHRIGNCSDAQAVSLHVYGVCGTSIDTAVNRVLVPRPIESDAI